MSATLTALPQAGFPVRAHRWLKLLAHLGRGLATVSFRFPAWDMAQRAAVSQQWSAQLLTIMGIEVKLTGQPPGLYPANTFLIANHVSWLDIFALNSVTVSRFVAKREIRQWPVIGMLVARAGTLFIDRSNRRDALRVNEILASSLREGDCMAVFPEGTTSDGTSVLPFKASLFDSAVQAGSTVQPVGLRYCRRDGTVVPEAAYVGEVTFLQSVRQMIAAEGLCIEIRFSEPICGVGHTRFTLAQSAERAVRRALNLSCEMPDTAVGIPDGRQDAGR